MPRQNRVNPWGEIISVSDRGLFMGNRGTLHDAHGQLTSQRWTRKPWVTCQLSFKDRHRQVMSPGQYTELFFLDEATALAAGHRPCATCQGDWHPSIKDLPNGTFVVLDQPDKAWLVWGSVLLEWSPGGYQSYMKRPDGEAKVLTPQSVVAVLDAGYKPELHPSAGAMVKAVTRQ